MKIDLGSSLEGFVLPPPGLVPEGNMFHNTLMWSLRKSVGDGALTWTRMGFSPITRGFYHRAIVDSW